MLTVGYGLTTVLNQYHGEQEYLKKYVSILSAFYTQRSLLDIKKASLLVILNLV